MANRVINLYSDTQSQPTPAMRQAMAEAEVGDEQRRADPSVNALCERVAALLGKEAAVFLPSGTMCNEIAILLHCRPGEEVICERDCHLIVAEGGAPAALAGVMMYQIDGERGIFTAEQVRAATRAKSRYAPRSRLVSVEQTSNGGGGSVWPLTTLETVAEVARQAGLALHMDGARLMNAAVASGIAAADFARPFDTVWIDLSKGLGCPVGGVLAGSTVLIEEAWIWKQRLGGAMRQAGIVAAAGLYALDHNVERLAEDHTNAKIFAEAIAGLPGLALDPAAIETNLVYFDVTAPGLDALSRRRPRRRAGGGGGGRGGNARASAGGARHRIGDAAMEARVKWVEKRDFLGQSGSGHGVVMSASAGEESLGPSPMEMLLLGLGGCSAYDVVNILEKMRQPVEDCTAWVTPRRSSAPSPCRRRSTARPRSCWPRPPRSPTKSRSAKRRGERGSNYHRVGGTYPAAFGRDATAYPVIAGRTSMPYSSMPYSSPASCSQSQRCRPKERMTVRSMIPSSTWCRVPVTWAREVTAQAPSGKARGCRSIGTPLDKRSRSRGPLARITVRAWVRSMTAW
jgi:threonine aldolase